MAGRRSDLQSITPEIARADVKPHLRMEGRFDMALYVTWPTLNWGCGAQWVSCLVVGGLSRGCPPLRMSGGVSPGMFF